MASVDELTRKYSSQLSQLRAIFPSWDESDLAFTLQDAKGNVEEAAMAITEGRASQFTQATRKKPVKTAASTQQGKGHTNRNADSGGWENVNGGSGEGFGGRGGRGGRGGARGGRGGRGGEPFRGGRGGARGGFRGGRGGFANVNGGASGATGTGGYAGAAKKANGFPTSTDTTADGWASQVEQSNAAEAADDGGWSTAADAASTVKADADDGGWGSEPPVVASNADDFSAAGGMSDAPAVKEVEAAAKQGGSDWQEEIKKPVPTAASTVPAAKPKLTWAQIAKPVEKPKPVPPPAPQVEPPAPTTTEEPTTEAPEEVPEEIHEENQAEPEEAWGDAPAQSEVEEQAEAIVEAEETYDSTQGEEQLETPAEAEEAQGGEWDADPAIAGIGSQPSFAQSAPIPAAAPEPVTTYTGPPGFNTVAAKAAAAAAQPRTASRAGRYKNADDQGVVLPAAASSVSAMEMQFGSLSFGGQGGDGVEAPIPEPTVEKTPVQQPPTVAPAVTSPIRAPQTAQPPQLPIAPPTAPSAIAPPSQAAPSTHPYYTQHQQQAVQPPSQPQGYQAPHQILQQQAPGYGSHYGQPQPQHQAPSHDQYQQSNYYRGQQDYSSAFGSQGQQQQHQQEPAQSQQSQQSQQQQHQAPSSQQHQQHSASPYDSGFGGFGGSQLFGQPQQSQQQQSDAFGAAQRAYDSYSASGYPRPPVDEPKQQSQQQQSAPAPPSSAPGQAQQANLHQNQYYSQLSNMGYYQAAPYNPYYQYGQAPSPGFQQYYPLAARGGNLYGQPTPQQSAPIPQASKPSPAPVQSPYGGPSPYPSSAFDDQSSLNVGRYGDSKIQSQQAQAPGSYQSQGSAGGLHNFLGGNGALSASTRPQASTPDEGFKSQSSQSQGSAAPGGAQNRSTPLQQGNNQQQHAGFNNYPYGGAASGGYGGQDWSQYGQHYGSRNGYSQWQQ